MRRFYLGVVISVLFLTTPPFTPNAQAAMGDYLYGWGAPYQFISPNGIAAGDDDRVYVVDTGSPFISVFDTSGTILSRFSQTPAAGSCWDIALGPAPDRRIYAICGGKIAMFDASENFLSSFGSEGAGEGQFYYPTSITVSDNGEVFVGDGWNNNIQVFNPDGVYLRQWQHSGGVPSGLEFDGPGILYMTDYYGRVAAYDPNTGDLLDWWMPVATWAFRIRGLAIDSAARELYLMMEHSGEVWVYSLERAGTYDRRPPPLRTWYGDEDGVGRLNATVKAVTLSPGGKVYIAEGHNYGVDYSMVKIYDKAGTFQDVWRAQGDADGRFAFPSAITVNDEGHVLVADDGNSRVQVFDPEGDFLWSFIHEPGSYYTTGLNVDEVGSIFAGTINPTGVSAYGPLGEFQLAWDMSNASFGGVMGGVAASGGRVYAADREKVQVFGTHGTALGPLDYVAGIQYETSAYMSNPYRSYPWLKAPTDVEIGADGQIYVVDGRSVVGFTTEGEAVSWTPLSTIGSLLIRSFAVDSCGNIFTLATPANDFSPTTIRVFDPAGLEIGAWSGEGIEDGQFRTAMGLAVDRAGRVFITDRDNHRVQVFAGVTTCGIPVADAGVDLTAHPGVAVTLDGSASTDPGGNALAYEWSLLTVPAGSVAALADPASATPSFSPDALGEYLVRLTVINAWGGRSEADQVLVTATNERPMADAGPDQAVIVIGSTVQLAGTAFDPDGDHLTVAWRFDSLPVGSATQLSETEVLDPTFTADMNGSYQLILSVNDPWGGSSSDSVLISFSNIAPVADAGLPQSVLQGDTVQFDGSASGDDTGDPLSFSWQLSLIPDGSTAEFFGADSVSPTFVADVPGQYVVSLIVGDGIVSSQPSIVTVTAISYEDSLTGSLVELLAHINTFPEATFANKNMRKTLGNKINAVIAMVEGENYQGALNKMQNDLAPKMDGCTLGEKDLRNDWIIGCEEQAQAYPLVLEIIDLLEQLLRTAS